MPQGNRRPSRRALAGAVLCSRRQLVLVRCQFAALVRVKLTLCRRKREALSVFRGVCGGRRFGGLRVFGDNVEPYEAMRFVGVRRETGLLFGQLENITGRRFGGPRVFGDNVEPYEAMRFVGVRW